VLNLLQQPFAIREEAKALGRFGVAVLPQTCPPVKLDGGKPGCELTIGRAVSGMAAQVEKPEQR
jgi:hypothetical protein